MRIRMRLALYGALIIGVAIVVFGILLTLLGQATAPEDQDKSLASLAEEWRLSLADASSESLTAALPLVSIDLSDTTEQFVVILDSKGKVLYATGQLDGTAPSIPASMITQAVQEEEAKRTIQPVDGVELRLVAQPWQRVDLGMSGIVVAGQSTAFVDQQLAGLRTVIWISGVVTVLGALVVGWIVAGRAVRPLRKLAETTDEIGNTGDLSRRLPEVKAKDEVGALTTSFNTMLGRLQDTRGQLTETLDAQRRFVADASHELRSPLTTIRNNAGFLNRRPDAGEDDRLEAIADISAEADRMTHLVDDLLFLAQADAGRPQEHMPVDLKTLLEDTKRRAQRLHPVRLDAAQAAFVMGDQVALERLIWILVDNAAKHGGGEIGLGLRTDGSLVSIEVTDGGPGIPDADQARLFERFYRVDAARSPTGVGLGLAIAKEVVEAHGGSISVANRPEGGAAFTVSLPLPPPPPQPPG